MWNHKKDLEIVFTHEEDEGKYVTHKLRFTKSQDLYFKDKFLGHFNFKRFNSTDLVTLLIVWMAKTHDERIDLTKISPIKVPQEFKPGGAMPLNPPSIN